MKALLFIFLVTSFTIIDAQADDLCPRGNDSENANQIRELLNEDSFREAFAGNGTSNEFMAEISEFLPQGEQYAPPRSDFFDAGQMHAALERLKNRDDKPLCGGFRNRPKDIKKVARLVVQEFFNSDENEDVPELSECEQAYLEKAAKNNENAKTIFRNYVMRKNAGPQHETAESWRRLFDMENRNNYFADSMTNIMQESAGDDLEESLSYRGNGFNPWNWISSLWQKNPQRNTENFYNEAGSDFDNYFASGVTHLNTKLEIGFSIESSESEVEGLCKITRDGKFKTRSHRDFLRKLNAISTDGDFGLNSDVQYIAGSPESPEARVDIPNASRVSGRKAIFTDVDANIENGNASLF